MPPLANARCEVASTGGGMWGPSSAPPPASQPPPAAHPPPASQPPPAAWPPPVAQPPPAAAAPHRRGADAPILRQVPEMYAWKEHEEEDEL